MKTCRVCKQKFTPMQSFQTWCCVEHGVILARKKLDAIKKAAHVKGKRETKEKLDKLKTRSDWIREAQKEFNQYVRLRDAGLPCICCGRTSAGMVHGGDFDAGHYRSRGSAPHLRFDERNCHAQLKQCNRYDSGNVVGYRMGLIERIGLAAVEALEADQEPRRHSIEDLKAIKREYAEKSKQLKVAA